MSEDISRAVNIGDSGLNHARFEHVHNTAAQQSFMFSSDPKVIGMLMFSDGQIVAKCDLTSLLDRNRSGFAHLSG